MIVNFNFNAKNVCFADQGSDLFLDLPYISSLVLCWQLDFNVFYIDLCLYPIFLWIFFVFYMNFLLSLFDVRLPKLLCFYNLTKQFLHSLYAVPLGKQCDWLYYTNFNAIPILQCLWLSFLYWLVHSLFLRLFQSSFSHIATNYHPIYFPMKIVLCNNNNNKAWKHQSEREVPWNPSYCYLYLHSLHKDPYFADLLNTMM